jgi:hypothetical protein
MLKSVITLPCKGRTKNVGAAVFDELLVLSDLLLPDLLDDDLLEELGADEDGAFDLIPLTV